MAHLAVGVDQPGHRLDRLLWRSLARALNPSTEIDLAHNPRKSYAMSGQPPPGPFATARKNPRSAPGCARFATVVRVIVVSIRRVLPTIHCRAPTRWVPIILRLHLTLTECTHKGSSLARPTPLRNAPLPNYRRRSKQQKDRVLPGLHRRSIQDRLANRSESKASSRSWGTSAAGESEEEGDHAEQIEPCRIVRGRSRFIKKSSCASACPIRRLSRWHGQVAADPLERERMQNRAVNKEPVPEPALGAAAEFSTRDGQVARAFDSDRAIEGPQGPGDPVEYIPMGDIDGRKPRRGRVGQDDRHIQCPGADHHRPPAARPPDDRHPVLLAGIDPNVASQPPRCPQHHGEPGKFPESQDRPCPSFVGLDQQRLVERQVRLDGLEGQLQERHRDGHFQIGRIFPNSRSSEPARSERPGRNWAGAFRFAVFPERLRVGPREVRTPIRPGRPCGSRSTSSSRSGTGPWPVSAWLHPWPRQRQDLWRSSRKHP